MFVIIVHDHGHNFCGFENVKSKGSSRVNCGLDILLLFCSFDYRLLNCILSYQSINSNFLCLPYSMSPVCSLSIHSRIPIIIIKYDCVCCCQGNSQSSCSRAEKETEDIVLSLVLLNHISSIVDLGASIHSEICKASPKHVFFKNVEHFGHLAENEASMALFFQFHK